MALIFGLFNSHRFNHSYTDKLVYENAELRSKNIVGIRTADFAIKKPDQSFLVAQQIPRELYLSIEFMDTGNYSAVIEAEYPAWLCSSEQLNNAYVDVRGGSANERVKLVREDSKEIFFSIAKGQNVTLIVNNPANRECGRALITFYADNQKLQSTVVFVLFWLLVFLLCSLIGASPYIATLGVLSNALLIAADVSLGSISLHSLVLSTGMSLFIVAGLLALSCVPSSKLLSLLLLVILTCVFAFPLAFIAYSYVFSTPMSGEALHGLMQSYDSQMIEFWQQFVGKKRSLILLLSLVVLYALIRHINHKQVSARHALAYSGLFAVVGLATSVGRIHENAMTNLVIKSIIEYKWEIDAFEKVANQRKDVSTKAQRALSHFNDTTVIVVGESVNKKFMSSYGYVQETTPRLQKRINTGEIVLYKNAYSNHTHSNPTMSYILTHANQYNGKSWLESPSVFNYANAASVKTQWLTNHRLLGGWSNHITTIVREADRLETINHKIGYGSTSSNYDEGLIPLFNRAITERPNQLTFLHLYNSHLDYCNRYPSDAKRFPVELPKALYGHIREIRKISKHLMGCYVNSIYYTDVVLEKLIQNLETKNEPSILVYVADHAEEVIDERIHNSANFTYDMVNIPLFIWANDAWRTKHSAKWKVLSANQNKVFTNDLMFEAILGIAGIESPSIDLKNDISSGSYQSLTNPLTLHGRVKINSPKNWNYWQSRNSQFARNRDTKLIAANIESIGQAFAASALDITSIHVKVGFIEGEGVNVFASLNSDAKPEPIMPLSDFASAISGRGIDKLLLSLVDKTPEQKAAMRQESTQLMSKYGVSIDLVSDIPDNIMFLSSPDFENLFNNREDLSKNLWVSFKSRYTDLASTLEN